MENFIEKGVYRHLINGTVYVIGAVKDGETDEYKVLYYTLQTKEFCYRSLKNFSEIITKKGKTGPRFSKVSKQEEIEILHEANAEQIVSIF